MDAHCTPSGDTRTLHALELPARLCDTGDARLRRGLYVDCETTGFSFEHDQAIELALLPFTYAVDDGRIAEVLHDEAQVHLQDPGRALEPDIMALTRLTDEDLRGCSVDVDAASALIARSDLIVAHNARFDRPFFERVLPATRAVPWACSLREVPWTSPWLPERRGALPRLPLRSLRPRPTPRARRLRGRRVAARPAPPRLRAARTGGAA